MRKKIQKQITIYVKNFVFNKEIILILTVFSFYTFCKSLSFDFWADDSAVLWGIQHNINVYFGYFRHPASVLEFFILTRIFGIHAVFWQIFGVVIKIINAYLVGVFLFRLTNSKLSGFLASLFFSVSYAGMAFMTSPLFNATGIVSIPILLSLIYFLKTVIENRRYFLHFVIYLLTAFFLEPARTVPVLFILPFFIFLFPKTKEIKFIKTLFPKLMIIFASIGIPAIILWFIFFASGTQLDLAIKGLFTNPGKTIVKVKDAGNFFATVANLFTEIIYGLKQKTISTAMYSKLFGRLGIIIFFLGVMSGFLYFRYKKFIFGIISLFIFWTFIFYLPNWFAEPRAPMIAENYYLFLSSIGFICLIAYMLSFIRNYLLVAILSLIFILLNIHKANTILSQEYPYRSINNVEGIWNVVLKTVPRNETKDVFIFKGQGEWIYGSLLPYGDFYYLLLRNYNNLTYAARLSNNDDFLVDNICSPKTIISHVYMWKIASPGRLVNESQFERERLLAKRNSCK